MKSEKGSLSNTDMEKKESRRRRFLKVSTFVAGVALVGILASSFGHPLIEAATKDRISPSKHNKKPELVFPVISDVHIKESGTSDLKKFETALDQLNRLAPKQDALVTVGDLTDHGRVEEYDRFMSVYNAKKQPQAVSMLAIGNHDYGNGLSAADAQKRFLDQTGMKSTQYHKVIKGYHFIVMGTEDGRIEGTFSKKQIAWLSERLKQAKKRDPQKPIFVFHHQPIKDTLYGSEWGIDINRDLLYDTLKDYPQVITFSGHTHYPLEDPRIIHQKDFTSIGTSTLSYLWLDAGRIQGEVPQDYADTLSQGLIVKVYKNKVKIERRNFHSNGWSGKPFEIQYPVKKSHFKYTETRDRIKPRFKYKSAISVVKEKTTATDLEIKFDQAVDNTLVHDYKIEAKNMKTGKVEKEFLAFSEFYKDPVPNPLTLAISGLTPDTQYQIEVRAIDSFGNASDRTLKVIGKTKRS